MEEETWVGDVPSAKAGAFPNLVVNQTNLHNDGCNFGNMTQRSHHETRMAVETTTHMAEERHQAYITGTKHAHLNEMESVRREAQNALHELASRHAWESHAAAAAAVVTTEAKNADVAQATGLRELELAF